VLKLEGKLLEPWLGTLRQVCAQANGVCLDLSAVTFVDAASGQMLRDLLSQGVTITACSNLVAELLQIDQNPH